MAEDSRQEGGRGTMPPYLAFQSVKTFVELLKPHKLPGRIDRSLLRSFSGSTQGQLITALRFLGLTDGKGIPTPRLDTLVQAYGTETWPEALAELLRNNYRPLFEIGLETASPGQFYERFRASYPGAEDVVRKSATFFLNAAREAKIEISEHITKNKKPRAAGGAARRRSKNTSRTGGVSAEQKPQDETPANNTTTSTNTGGEHNGATTPRATSSFDLLAAFDPSDMTDEEQQAIWTLLRYLRRKETARTSTEQRRQRQTKTAATAVETKEATVEPPP